MFIMTRKILLYCCCIILLISFNSYGFSKNKPSFIQFGVESGLAQNTVYCILQDKQGFMWFGTKDGLSRFDGNQFRNYRNDNCDPHSIGNNCIRSIFQGSDDNIWVGTDKGVYVYNPEKDNFDFFNVKTHEGLLIEKEVNDIKQDQNGVFWFAVDWQGVFSFNPHNKELIFYELNAIVNAWCIHIDAKNKVWIGTHGGGLNCFNEQNKRFEKANFVSTDQSDINIDDIYQIFQDNYNNLLITTANSGVIKLNQVNNEIECFAPLKNYTSLFIRDGVRKTDNEIWFGTGSGICTYNYDKRNITFLQHSYLDPYSLSDNAVYAVYKDREGGIWVGTYFGGVNYFPYQYTPFNKYYPIQENPEPNSLIGRRIREFQLTNDGDLWIGSEDGGLSLYNPESDTFESYLPNQEQGSISFNNIHGLCIDEENLWIGTYNHGLDIMDLKTKKVIRHYEKTDNENSISDNSIFSIYKDHSGRVWVGTLYGLCYYNRDEDNFTRITSLGNIFVNDILQTKNGLIWVGTLGKGLYQFNPHNNEWTIFKNNPEDSTSISHNKIISLFEDSKKTLWITTEGGGLCRYNSEENNFTSFTTHQGLPNNVVYRIVEDNHSKLWYTTNKGLVCMSLNDFSIKQFTRSDGLLSNQFNYKSGIKDNHGNIYFGGLEGFISFNPSLFIPNECAPNIYITHFELFNSIVRPEDENSPLKYAIEFTKEIVLKYNQSTFGFSFAALSYVAPEKNQYAYMLEGFDRDWVDAKNSHKASYSNIPPGQYSFKVKATNNNGIWSDNMASVDIIITPPYYKTIWAYLIYLLFFITSLFFLIVSFRNRQNKKNMRRLEIYENEKAREIYDAKIAFFTNIAHEIRTPLSLIKGPLDYIITSKVSDDERDENLNVIDRNTNRLLELSNQLLDFRKTEEKGFQLNFVSTDIPQLVNDTYFRFRSTALRKNLNFKIEHLTDKFYADVDKEALTKILSNLFTNALKYAYSQIHVESKKNEESFHLIISSDGNKIKKHLEEKIFEPFYQIHDKEAKHVVAGTGLGLPLSRSLAELHGGKLIYMQTSNEFNSFQLTLPITQSSVVKYPKPLEEDVQQAIPKSNQQSKHSILIVEDDDELRAFLYSQLKKKYNVWKASDGTEAIKKLNSESVDLVISDIVMPVMDGYQLCKEVKLNLNYSHIPIILLTAKSNVQSKIEGLEAGADAYLEKPFSMDHIFAQVSNLLSNRQKLKEAFISSPLTKIKTIAPTKADEDFLKNVNQVIQANISDVQFNVDTLASALNMSRSSLHRKIKGVSELTPNELILLVKLKKAVEYLQEGYKINEICFIVGFNSPSYFSKVFKKQFGVSPKNWNQ